MIDYDLLSAEYARHRKVHPEVLKDLLAISHISPASRVLEVGCGTGNYIRSISTAAGSACWGIDPSENMLAKAREAAPQVTLHQGKGEFLEFEPETFDLVFSVDVIHHVVGRKEYFGEAYRVLRPGGYFCTVTDSEWIIRHRVPLTAYFPETVEVELKRYPPLAELERFLGETGFTALTSRLVEFHYRLTDAQPFRDKAYSSLHLIEEDAFRRGIDRMERDLTAGPIPCVSYYSMVWGKKIVDFE